MKATLNRILKELEEELDFHGDLAESDLAASGAPEHELRKKALIRQRDRGAVMYACLQQRYPVLKMWSSDLMAHAMLALGLFLVSVAALTAWQVYLRAPASFPVGGEWLIVGTRLESGSETFESSTETYEAVKSLGLFDRVTAASYRREGASLKGRRGVYNFKYVSPGYFAEQGIQVEYLASSSRFGVIVDRGMWQSEFGSSPPSREDTLTVGESSYPVVGITRQPVSAYLETDAFLPLSEGATEGVLISVRLKPARDRRSAEKEMRDRGLSHNGGEILLRAATSVYGDQLDRQGRGLLWLLGLSGLGLILAAPVTSRRHCVRHGLAGGLGIVAATSATALTGTMITAEETSLFQYAAGADLLNPMVILLLFGLFAWAITISSVQVRMRVSLAVAVLVGGLSTRAIYQSWSTLARTPSAFADAISLPVLIPDWAEGDHSLGLLDRLSSSSTAAPLAFFSLPPNEVKVKRLFPFGPNETWIPVAYNEATVSAFEELNLDVEWGVGYAQGGYVINNVLADQMGVEASDLPTSVFGTEPIVGIIENHPFDGPRSREQPLVYGVLSPDKVRYQGYMVVNASRGSHPPVPAAFHKAVPEAYVGPIRFMVRDAFYQKVAMWSRLITSALALIAMYALIYSIVLNRAALSLIKDFGASVSALQLRGLEDSEVP